MTINKRAGRSIKKNIAFYIISIILTMLTSMVIVAAASTGHTLTKVVDDFVKDYKAEDAEFVTYQPLSDADMEKLEQEYDVILEHSRYKDVNVESGDLKGATIRVFPMPEKLNLCEVRDGHEPGDGEALLTQDFADMHDIRVGDTISLGAYDYKVSAYTTKADYIYMLDKLSGYIDSEKFALVVVDRKEYDKIDADETSYYSIKYNKDNSKEVREKLNEGYVIASYMAAPRTHESPCRSMREMPLRIWQPCMHRLCSSLLSRLLLWCLEEISDRNSICLEHFWHSDFPRSRS